MFNFDMIGAVGTVTVNPAMLVPPPESQWRPQYTFSTMRSNETDWKHYAIIVIQQSYVSNILGWKIVLVFMYRRF